MAIPTPTKYQLPFPEAFERALAPLDDAVVRVVQKNTSGAIHVFVMSLTFFSAIEISLTAPATLFALGYDRAAGLCFSVLWVLCIISQIPKKFVFRRRPWMSGRALPIRQDRTSSFPSRAVVCAVVFSWLVGQSLELENVLPYPLPRFQLWVGIIVVSALTAFARINVGAHYASDTLFGFLLGLFVINLGSRHESLWQITGGCTIHQAVVISKGFTKLSILKLVMSTIVAYGMTLVSIRGFWVKCSYVYGLLLSSAAFRAAFLCTGLAAGEMKLNLLAPVENHGSIGTHIRAALCFMIFLFFGMATRGNKGRFRVVSFSLIYLGSLSCIMYWRLLR